MAKLSDKMGVRVVTLPCKDNRQNQIKIVREPHGGELYMEVQGRHGGVEVFFTLRIGRLWEVLPRLATLS